MKNRSKKGKRFGMLGMALALSAGLMQNMAVTAQAGGYEARIGDTYYLTIEEAFENVQPGDTIIALENCSVSTTLIVEAEDVTLESEDPENPVTISRDEDMAWNGPFEFAYRSIIAVKDTGIFTTQDVTLDGGAVLDENFENNGLSFESPLICTAGTYYMKNGTILQNNHYNNGIEGLQSFPAAGVNLESGGAFFMSGGVIQNCYSNGFGGGIRIMEDESAVITGGIVRNCASGYGGGVSALGRTDISGLTIEDCFSASNGGGIVLLRGGRMTDCIIQGNSALSGGGIYISGYYGVELENCTITGNCAENGAAVKIFGVKDESEQVSLKDCIVTENSTHAAGSGAVDYAHYGGILLNGTAVFSGNVSDGETLDISIAYQEAEPVILGESFESTSTFMLGGSEELAPVKKLVDGSTYGKGATLEQFLWNDPADCITLKAGDIYLDEEPKQEDDGGNTDSDEGSGGDDGNDDNASSSASENADAGEEKEPMIQTGRTSPLFLLSVPGACGVLLIFLSMAGITGYRTWEKGQVQKFQDIAKINEAAVRLSEQPGITEAVRADCACKELTLETDYDWASLTEINEDIKGWLYLPDTSIDFPVVETTDNEYYLAHNFQKEESSMGCPFMDKDTRQEDFNKVIYAHNMGRGSTAMFSQLLAYKDEDYFKEHRTVYFTETFGTGAAYQIMAVVKYDVKDVGEWDFRTKNHASMEEYNVWMEQLQERALYYAEPDHAPDSILTLATCDRTELGKDGRLIIIAGNI